MSAGKSLRASGAEPDAAEGVTVVVPARNAERTLGACLSALVPLLDREVDEILVVDDGSTDRTAEIASAHGVRVLTETGRGAGAARNRGWREARTPLVWFVDADCVPESGALAALRAHLDADATGDVVGVGGTYTNLRPDSWVATCIHEEIEERHRAMDAEVDFLATFDVLYRRDALAKVDGFDERFAKAQDAELAFRLRRAGGRLRFDRTSRVGHFHPTRLRSYLRTQRDQGYWRVWLYFEHPGRMGGDSYSGLLDHVQPPLAALACALAPALALPGLRGLPLLAAAALWLAPLPMAARIARRTRRPVLLSFAFFAALRSFARAAGMVHATLAVLGRVGRRAGRRGATA